MDNLLVMGVADDLGNLTDQVQPGADGELVLLLGQKMIEPDGERIVLEDQRRADLVLGEAVDAQDARMLERVQQQVFPACRTLNGLAFPGRRPAPDQVQANPPLGFGDGGMAGLPVLVAGAFADELFQDVVADLAVPLRRSDAGLLHRLADHPGHGPVVRALGG